MGATFVRRDSWVVSAQGKTIELTSDQMRTVVNDYLRFMGLRRLADLFSDKRKAEAEERRRLNGEEPLVVLEVDS